MSNTTSCASCGQTGHTRSNSKLCPLNPKRRRTSSPEPDQSTSPVRCSRCGQTGHARSNSASCPLNTKRRRTIPALEPDQAEVDIIQENNQPAGSLQEDSQEDSLQDDDLQGGGHPILEIWRHPAAFVEREQVTRYTLGRMDRTCPHCGAKLFVEVLQLF